MVEAVVESAVDGLEGAAQSMEAAGRSAARSGAEWSVVEFGVEDRPADTVGGEPVGVGVRESSDEAFEAQASQVEVVCAVAQGRRAAGSPGTETPIGEADGGVHHRTEGAGQCHYVGVSEAQCRSPLALVGGG